MVLISATSHITMDTLIIIDGILHPLRYTWYTTIKLDLNRVYVRRHYWWWGVIQRALIKSCDMLIAMNYPRVADVIMCCGRYYQRNPLMSSYNIYHHPGEGCDVESTHPNSLKFRAYLVHIIYSVGGALPYHGYSFISGSVRQREVAHRFKCNCALSSVHYSSNCISSSRQIAFLNPLHDPS